MILSSHALFDDALVELELNQGGVWWRSSVRQGVDVGQVPIGDIAAVETTVINPQRSLLRIIVAGGEIRFEATPGNANGAKSALEKLLGESTPSPSESG